MRIKVFVDEHLGDSALDSQQVAAALGLSVRYLNRLLAAEGTSLGRTIWHRRLDRCAQRLRDLAWAGVSVSVIALDHGFNDLSHFSRVFRQRFGVAPRDYRNGSGNDAR